MLKQTKKCLKTLENSGIWPREGGTSNPKDYIVLLKTSFTFKKLYYQGLVLPQSKFCQNHNYQKLTIFLFLFFENLKNEIRFTRSTKKSTRITPRQQCQNLVCCRRQPKIKPILLKIYVVVRVRIIPTESI